LILRPDAVVLPGAVVQPGLEVCIESGAIVEIRPWTSASRTEVGQLLSPAFVNAHSHLEYFDLQDRLPKTTYWPWIREITRIKPSRLLEQVAASASAAARQNVETGVAAICECSDWPVSGAAMRGAGLQGRIYQEVITVAEADDAQARLALAREYANQNRRASGLPTYVSAHATYTVDRDLLTALANGYQAIHAAETEEENQFFLKGQGPIAELYKAHGKTIEVHECTAIQFLSKVGALNTRTQLIHSCAIDESDIEIIADSGSTVSHCPRSNIALGCPVAPVAALRNRGVKVGLGLDSAASSGPIDMFAEMRAAHNLANGSLQAADIWEMATSEAAAASRLEGPWEICRGSRCPLLLLNARPLQELIDNGSPADVRSIIGLETPALAE
jgi:5-methylthioadenosine/S-adenosylhomocysteine deaminase